MLKSKVEDQRRRRDDVNLEIKELDRVAICVKSHKLLKQLLKENPRLNEIMKNAHNKIEALVGVKNWVIEILEKSPVALTYYQNASEERKTFEVLEWRDYAAIRLLDYIDNAGREFRDLNLRGEVAVTNPIKLIWLATTYGTGGAKPYFFKDMLQLFRQLSGVSELKLYDLVTKRAEAGISPKDIDKVIGARLLRAVEKDWPINWKDIQ